MKQAELLLVKTVKHNVYNWTQFYQQKVHLRLFIGDDILRCKGGISKPSPPYDSQNPIYLPKCNFSKLLVKFNHSKVLQNGVKNTLNELWTRFWISKARTFISGVIKNRFIWKKAEGLTCKYPPAPDLLSIMVAFASAFRHTGVD